MLYVNLVIPFIPSCITIHITKADVEAVATFVHLLSRHRVL